MFTDAKGYRATLIARSEVITASNQGNLEAYKQSGVVKQKMWLTSRDDRVRDEHIPMDGETVDIDKPFSNGSMVPDSPNERCTIIPVIKE